MTRYQKIGPIAAGWAAILVLGGYVVFAWQLIGRSRLWQPDFIGYYTAAKIVWTGQGSRLYDLALQNRIEAQLAGVPVARLLPLPYDSPPHFAVLVSPLATLSYETAYLAWIFLMLALFAAGLALLCRGLGFPARSSLLLALVAMTFFPVFVTVLRGQLDGAVFLFLVAAFLAWRDGRDAPSGGWLGLALAKFHLLFALPLMLLARRAWFALLALAAVAAAAVVLAAAVLGPAIWARYLDLLLPVAGGRSSGFAHASALSYSLTGLAVQVGLPSWTGLVAAALLLLGYLAWAARARLDRDLLFSAAVPVSVLASPHQGLQDLSLLLLPALVLVRRSQTERLPRPWIAVALFGAIYALSFISADGAAGWAITLLMLGFAGYLFGLPGTEGGGSGTQVAAEAATGRSGQGRTLVAILTYNERGNIERLAPQVLAVSPELDLLIVDDSSPDGTGEIVDALAAGEPRLHVVHRPAKLGVGSGYRFVFEWMLEHGYDWLVHMDADLSHRPEELHRLLDARGGADVVLGSRNIAGGSVADWSLRRRLLSRFGSFYVRSILGIPVHDCTTGYKCVSRQALAAIDRTRIRAGGYAIQVELLQAWVARGFRIVEVPITFPDRERGRSKMSWRIGLEAALVVLTIRFRRSSA